MRDVFYGPTIYAIATRNDSGNPFHDSSNPESVNASLHAPLSVYPLYDSIQHVQISVSINSIQIEGIGPPSFITPRAVRFWLDVHELMKEVRDINLSKQWCSIHFRHNDLV